MADDGRHSPQTPKDKARLARWFQRLACSSGTFSGKIRLSFGGNLRFLHAFAEAKARNVVKFWINKCKRTSSWLTLTNYHCPGFYFFKETIGSTEIDHFFGTMLFKLSVCFFPANPFFNLNPRCGCCRSTGHKPVPWRRGKCVTMPHFGGREMSAKLKHREEVSGLVQKVGPLNAICFPQKEI